MDAASNDTGTGEGPSLPSAAGPPAHGEPGRSGRRLAAALALALLAALASLAAYVYRARRTPAPPQRLDPDALGDPPAAIERDASVAEIQQECIELGRSMLQAHPGRVEPLLLLAEIHHRLGQTAEAKALWSQVLEVDPARPEAHEGIGWDALQAGEFEAAAASFARVIQVEPHHPAAHNLLARALMGLGRIDESILALRRDLEISPRSTLSLFLLAQQLLQRGDFEEARRFYSTLIELDPSHSGAVYGLAQAQRRLGRQEEAARLMERFRQLKELELENLKRADKEYDDLAAAKATAARAHLDAGRICRAAGDATAAESHWRRAAALDPGLAECRAELAALLRSRGETDEAIRWYEEARRADPQDLVSLLSLGQLHAERGDFARAEEALRGAIGAAPGSAWGYRDLAQLYLNTRRDPAEAARLARSAVSLEKTAVNYDILSRALYTGGDLEAALAAMEEALRLEPQNAEYRRRWEALRSRR
ncbi:MAG: tetratricopeptide repeat protein [Planctomycetes bacterium]|nr:tetratricopeptide repeat protein [Planctomycetota bacterium]